MHAAAEPVPPPSPGADAAARFQVHAWRPALRLLSTAAQVLCAVSLLYLSASALLGPLVEWESLSRLTSVFLMGLEPLAPIEPMLRLALLLLALLGLPRAIVWLLGRFSSATLLVEPTQLVLQLRRVRFEIPRESITAIEPWRLPLPGSGLTLRMKSGRRFQYQLQATDHAALLAALGPALPSAAPAANHAGWRFGQARHEWRRRLWDRPALKLGLLPLLPTGIMFRAHQYITWGGPFGEYDVFGLSTYLKTFVGFWHTFAIGILLYVGCWRILAELLAFALTWLMPSRAHGVRRAAEWVCRLTYYVGIPAIIAPPFLG